MIYFGVWKLLVSLDPWLLDLLSFYLSLWGCSSIVGLLIRVPSPFPQVFAIRVRMARNSLKLDIMVPGVSARWLSVAHPWLGSLVLRVLWIPTIILLSLFSLEISENFVLASFGVLAIGAIVPVVAGHHQWLCVAQFVKILVLLFKMSEIIPFRRIIYALVLRIFHLDGLNILGIIESTILIHTRHFP